ncbi:MAG: DUF3656 domain-containing U32 family peptidase [Pseudoramibacter sp.]|jgi:putative protease
MKIKRNRPEVLAPAGNEAEIIAAINAGADAVYFGGPFFNARLRAENIDIDHFKHMVRLCHQYGVKVYITVNTLVKDEEWAELIRYIDFLNLADVDGMIVQDPGLIFWIRANYPMIKLQTSTQASIGGLNGVKFFENLGFFRTVLPREMPIKEIKKIRQQTDIELKVFIHGALCYARSGQCLMSSLIGGRSGNRGMCAQPCRKRYRLTDENGRTIKQGYLLSMKDLNTSNHVAELVNAGIDAFKIEGRLKSPQYVYQVTQLYRQLVDGKGQSTSSQELDSVFGRDFTPGWMFSNKNHLNTDVQKKRGAYIGKIENIEKGVMKIQLDGSIQLNRGDGLAFGKNAQVGCSLTSFSQRERTVKMNRISGVKKGMPVYRNKNVKLAESLTEKAEQPLSFNKIPLDISLSFSEEEPVSVQVKNANIGQTQAFEIKEIKPSLAKKHALTEEMVRQQIQKLGDTDFYLSEFSVTLNGNLFLSRSDLNRIRREIIAAIDPVVNQTKIQQNTQQLRYELETKHREVSVQNNPQISLRLWHYGQYAKFADMQVDEWAIPLEHISEIPYIKKIGQDIHNKGEKLRLILPEIINTQKGLKLDQHFEMLDNLEIDGYLVRNYEGLEICRRHGTMHSVEADTNLQVFNAVSTMAFNSWGCDRCAVSCELDGSSLKKLNEKTVLPLSLNVYGFQEVMVSDNCVINCQNHDCTSCKNNGRYHLIDEKGASFPLVLQDQKVHIFNADKLCLTSKELKDLDCVDVYRINVLNEEPKEIAAAIAFYRHPSTATAHLQNSQYRLTTGNFHRGIQ